MCSSCARRVSKLWKVGFDNIVLNLAPATKADKDKSKTEMMSAHACRTVIETKSVDCCYILRCLLVRVNYLVKAASVRSGVAPLKDL